MAKNDLLEADNHKLPRAIFNSLYGDSLKVDFSDENVKIEAVEGGRLSYPFIITAGDNQFFAKISKAGSGDDNPVLGAILSEKARVSGIPCPKIYKSDAGSFDAEISQNIDGIEEDSEFLGQKVTFMELVEKKEIPAGTKIPNYEDLREIGRYNARFANLDQDIDIPQGLSIEDPMSIGAIEKLIKDNFSIYDVEESKIEDHIANLANNLNKSDELSAKFASDLKKGDVSFILKKLKQVNENIANFPDLPQGWINNDIKPNNLFMQYDKEANKVEITSAFDYDLAGRGALIKDLGRTISFTCFDGQTGQFDLEKAQAVIEGYCEVRKLSDEEKAALPEFIKLGLINSYALRSSYFANELNGRSDFAKIDRLDPHIHLEQIGAFEEWSKSNSLFNQQNKEKNMSQQHDDMSSQNHEYTRPAPAAPDNTKLGPGPTPAPIMGVNDHLKWLKELEILNADEWKELNASLDAVTGLAQSNFTFYINACTALINGALDRKIDGRLHRDHGLVEMTGSTMQKYREFLKVPNDHSTAFVDGGGHGAMEMAMVNLLSKEHNVKVIDFGAFGETWAKDVKQLKEKHDLDVEHIKIDPGTAPGLMELVNSGQIGKDDDVIFPLNETSTGVSIAQDDLDAFAKWRQESGGKGVTLIDATSGAGTMTIPEGFSYTLPGQKMLGAPSDIAIMVVDPNAYGRIAEKKPWVRLKMQNLATSDEGKVRDEVLVKPDKDGNLPDTVVIRSTSMKSMAETNRCISWLLNNGGLEGSIKRSVEGSRLFQEAVNNHISQEKGVFGFLAEDESHRGAYNCVLTCVDQDYGSLDGETKKEFQAYFHEVLDKNDLLKDIKPFPVEGIDCMVRLTTKDIKTAEEAQRIMDCLEWGFEQAKAKFCDKSKEVDGFASGFKRNTNGFVGALGGGGMQVGRM
ncbi:aminotransferase class V-fold PLP-dependent enzyme [Rickettsiales bacterium]|nr:aminotransferase class V-fold PLP-dependent enzyme [Rickettsiales bacterium]